MAVAAAPAVTEVQMRVAVSALRSRVSPCTYLEHLCAPERHQAPVCPQVCYPRAVGARAVQGVQQAAHDAKGLQHRGVVHKRLQGQGIEEHALWRRTASEKWES